jgi:hypothetical protein
MWSRIYRVLYPSYFQRKERRTVHYAFPILAVTALFTGIASVVSQDASYISITTEPSTVHEGESFYIDVFVYAHTPVNAVDIALRYPSDQMTVENIDTGTSVITLWAMEPYADKDKIYLRGGLIKKGFLGKHSIARIRAHATQSGLAYVNVASASLIAGDGFGTEVQLEKVSESETRIIVNSDGGTLSGEASVSLITDLDGDGKVDFSDISAFMSAWFTRGKIFDFNRDGRMTLKDFSILLSDSFFR